VTTEALDLLGVTNVASEVKAGKLLSVSFEQVLVWNPDWILTTDPAFAATAPTDPLWKSLPAIKKGNFRLSPLYPFPWLDSPPSVNRLLGLVWLGKLLYPDTFNEDLPDFAAAFHERIYHRRPSPSQLSSVLSPAKTSP
jgi:iron complex transport system substrate-binding protein